MLRDHIITFLEAAVIFLLMTNAVSACAAICAIWAANDSRRRPPVPAAARRLDAFLRRAA
jgi:hypothetical protein